MKKIEGKIVSASELSRLISTDDSEGITYGDIEKMLSDEDVKE